MTDPVDQMLRTAGEQWRAAQPPPPEIDVSRLRGRRRWVPLVAAASVVLVAAGVVYATGSSPPEPAAHGPSRLDRFVVREGTTVRATGEVAEQGGGKVDLCWPGSSAVRNCPSAVPVVGFDFTKQAKVHEYDGLRVVLAQVTGVWKGGVLTVTEQAPPDADWDAWPEQFPLPCSPPDSGWRNSTLSQHGVRPYLNEHADQFGMPWFSRTVFVVPVVEGDVAQARREIESRYDGDLCVVDALGRPSLAERNSAKARLDPLVQDPANGALYYDPEDLRPLRLELRMVTPELLEKFGWIGDEVEFKAWLQPVS
jgi:hypothetical protein